MKKNSFTISLRGLQHPLTLASIGLLLFNDHILKTASPSPLTGKLSDFAGLFFFPFLLTALLGLIADRFSVPANRTTGLAFGLTAFAFGSIKMVPLAHAWAVSGLSLVFGAPVQIIRDPTDIIALVSLVSAWKLWRQVSEAPTLKPLGTTAYIALGLASLATLATQPCVPKDRITRLVMEENSIYTWVSKTYTVDEQLLYVSENQGVSWTIIAAQDAPAGVIDELLEPRPLPAVACDPSNPQHCYRVAGNERVERSTDGGETWEVDWRLPPGRDRFMHRLYGLLGPYSSYCGNKVDLGPYDIIVLPEEMGAVTIVALGNEGVLVKPIGGEWKRYEVGQAFPTPYTLADPTDLPIFFLNENILTLVVVIVVWLILTFVRWGAILTRVTFPPGQTARWALTPAIVGTVILAISLGWTDFARRAIAAVPFLLIFIGGLLFWLIGSFITSRRVGQYVVRREMARQALLKSFYTTLGFFPLAWLPFPLWAFGIIPFYNLALALAALIGLLALVWGAPQVKRASALSVSDSENL